MQQLGYRRMEDYLLPLENYPALRTQTQCLLTVCISRFFRDVGLWQFLEKDALPRIIAKSSDTVKVWSAGCAAGLRRPVDVQVRNQLEAGGSDGLSQAAGFLMPLQFLQFSRGAERGADHLGLQYANKAGDDPTAVIPVFAKLQAPEKRKPETLPSSFPPSANCRGMEKAQPEIATVLPDRDQYVVSSSNSKP